MATKVQDLEGDTFTVTNFIERIAFNANTATLAETNDTLATVIRNLQQQGILKGTVAS